MNWKALLLMALLLLLVIFTAQNYAIVKIQFLSLQTFMLDMQLMAYLTLISNHLNQVIGNQKKLQ